MINLRELIDLLPQYFKDNDSYKDANGKGILERFLSIFGDYFKDEIQPEVDDILNTIDIGTTDPKLLNFIWELMGAVPYAYGVMMSNTSWNTYSPEAPNDPANWNEVTSTEYPLPDFRNLLKYIIPIYKKRGTLDFFPLLLSFYGYETTIVDETGDYNNPTPVSVDPEYTPLFDNGLLYDDDVTYDISRFNCLKCRRVEIHIVTGHPITEEFKTRIQILVNKYRPVYVKPIFFESYIQPAEIPVSSRIFVSETDSPSGLPLTLPITLN